LGGGVAAVTALNAGVLAKAQELVKMTGTINPETLLWTPGSETVLVPPEKLIIEPTPAGVACFRLVQTYEYGRHRAGTYWFDRDGALMDVLGPDWQPMSLLDGTGPDLVLAKQKLGQLGREVSEYQDRRTVRQHPSGAFFSTRKFYGLGKVDIWPDLVKAPVERDTMTRIRIEW
jgi:hypothetical protein